MLWKTFAGVRLRAPQESPKIASLGRRSRRTLGGALRARRSGSQDEEKLTNSKRLVAYFSMEIALENAMPSYSGGLGVLAGDTIRAAADIRVPMVAVSLLYRKGFFAQHLSEDGSQTEGPIVRNVEDFLKEEPAPI